MPKAHVVVGLWYVTIKGAPFERHLFTFHADGTMLQANPDAGDKLTSDSVGMGVWQTQGNLIRGKFVELMADRQTHQFVSTGVIDFSFECRGDSLSGQVEANFYDASNRLINGPLPGVLRGQRIRADVPLWPNQATVGAGVPSKSTNL